ncbi:MAG: polyprenyl synthetase family protein [Planctomycetota bacterium]|nr:polyprenyl synthetase family protein [Planctomycetota bacterium]
MSPTTFSLEELLAPVQADLERMRQVLIEALSTEGLVGERTAHVARFRGKELRAAMVLLCGQATGRLTDEHPKVAAVLELIHLATLVHDDVLDGADVRRNLPSVHVVWDEQTAILMGDMLYSRAFHLSTCLSSNLAARVLSMGAQRICAGELEQAARRYDFGMSQQEYEGVASAKTAELYAAACELGARYPDSPEEPASEQARMMRGFGEDLGLAFQIIDDVLDLTGEASVVGKSVGNDVEDGKVTLPVLHVYANADAAGRKAIESAFRDPCTGSRMDALRSACDLEPGIAHAKQRAHGLLTQALQRLMTLPDTTARRSLIQITEYVASRQK